MTLAKHLQPGETTMLRRRGFTLVELMVALALIIFIMSILSEAFVAAAKVFRDFKAIGDMNGKLRSATQLLRDDLSSSHFEDDRKLSDANFWQVGPPRLGFFRIWQQAAATNEGVDIDSIESWRGNGTWLHLSVRKRGNEPQDFFLADLSNAAGSPLLTVLPGGAPLDSRYQDSTIFKSQWAEVAWFLKPNGAFVNANTPLYAVYRRQRLAVQDNYYLNWNAPGPVSLTPPGGYEEISWWPNGTNYYFNMPTDLTVPERRFGMNNTANSGGIPTETDGSYPIFTAGNVSSDVMLTDVISMDVRVLVAGQTEFYDLATLPGATFNNSAFNTVTINGTATAVKVFDTWSSASDGIADYSGWATAGTATSAPLQVQILAIKVTFRIWDFKTEQARQVSIIQDL